MRNGRFASLPGTDSVSWAGDVEEIAAQVGGWAQRHFDDAAREQATEQVLAADTFLLGRRTYELLERAWSQNIGPYAEALHKIPKLVVTNTPRNYPSSAFDLCTNGKSATVMPSPRRQRRQCTRA